MSPEQHVREVMAKAREIASPLEELKIQAKIAEYETDHAVHAITVVKDLVDILGYARVAAIIQATPPN